MEINDATMGDLKRFVANSTQSSRRMAILVDETMLEDNGFVPAAVFEGEWGYYPLKGNGIFAEPWYWGHDIVVAKKIAADANRALGLTESDVRDIIVSSMWAKR